MNAEVLWTHFCSEFSSLVAGADTVVLDEVWSNRKRRTAFYASLMQALAGRMGYTWRREWSYVDHALCVQDEENPVPHVFVESENEYWDAAHEVRKLCSLGAPLRVLISVAEWEDGSDVWNHRRGGRRTELVTRWRSIVDSHAAVWPNPGIIGFIIGERLPAERLAAPADLLRFQTFAFRHDGKLHEPEQTRVSIPLPPRPSRPMRSLRLTRGSVE